MPELSTQLLLDGLLAFIVLLFVPFGVRRGVAREAIVSAGIFLGGLTAEAWAAPASAWLARTFGIEAATGAFAASLVALLAGAFLLGYGGSAVVSAGHPGVSGRLAGAVLAAFNGALFLSFLLRFIETNLQPGPGLDDGIVANVLLRRFDDVLLAAGAAMLLCLFVGWLSRAARRERVVAVPAAPVRPARSGDLPDAGKFEPVVPAGPVRVAPVLQETAPLPADPGRGQWRQPAPANGHGAAPADAAWRDGATVAGGAGGGAWTSWGQGAADDAGRRFAAAPASDPVSARRCPTCSAVAGPNDAYCPQCGKSM